MLAPLGTRVGGILSAAFHAPRGYAGKARELFETADSARYTRRQAHMLTSGCLSRRPIIDYRRAPRVCFLSDE